MADDERARLRKEREAALPPRQEDPQEAAGAERARARVERFVIITLVAAIAVFAWSLFRGGERAPSPGVDTAPAQRTPSGAP